MSTEINIRHVKNHYQKLTDAQLIRTTTKDAAGLTPEAVEIIKEEIEKRNLDPNLVDGLEAQNKTYTLENHSQLIKKLTKQEYHHYKANELRGFSGHWLLFYMFSAMGLYPIKKPVEK